MKRYHFVCLLFFLFFWLPLSFAIPVEKLTFNEPVIDQAQMLSNEERTDLNAKFWHYRRKNLMQAAVVLVDNTEGEGVFNYGMEIFDRWKLGDKDRDHGLLLLIARDEQRYHLFTGKGLEGVLPDITVKRILNMHLKPEFEKGYFAAGIAHTFMVIENRLLADDEIRANLRDSAKDRQSISTSNKTEDEIFRERFRNAFLIFMGFLFTVPRLIFTLFRIKPKDPIEIQRKYTFFYTLFPCLILLMGLYSLTDLPFFVCLVISLIIFNVSYNRVKRNHRTKTEDDDNAIIVFGHGRDDSNGFSFGRGDFSRDNYGGGGFGGDGYDGGGGDSAGGGAGGGWGDSDGDSGGGDGGGDGD